MFLQALCNKILWCNRETVSTSLVSIDLSDFTVKCDVSKPASESCSEKWAFLCFLVFFIFLMCVDKIMMLLDVLFWLSWLKNEYLLYLLFLHAESAGVRRVGSECELISCTPVWKLLFHILGLLTPEMGQCYSFPRLWLNIWLLWDFWWWKIPQNVSGPCKQPFYLVWVNLNGWNDCSIGLGFVN